MGSILKIRVWDTRYVFLVQNCFIQYIDMIDAVQLNFTAINHN